MRPAHSAPFLRQWPLLGLATLFVVLVAASVLVWAGTSPAGAQDGYQPDQDLINDVWGYARETDNGFDYVLRWMRVLKTLGAVEDMTAAEAQGYADQRLGTVGTGGGGTARSWRTRRVITNRTRM